MAVSLDPQWERLGWAVCYSRSQGRHYYFNKNNGKSVWHLHELEQLEGAPQRLPPPDHNAPEAKRARLEDDNEAGLEDGDAVFSGETVQFVQKRRLSSVSCHEIATMVIKKADAGVLQSHRLLWDIDTSSNVVINVDRTFEEQRHYRHLLPPHPDIELMRFRSTVTLRKKYEDLCRSKVGVEEPKESFNRWLLERKVLSISGDPLLPALSLPKISQSMHREIIADVPVKLKRARNPADARKNLLTYAEAARTIVEKRGGTNAQRKTIKWTTEDAFKWMRDSQPHTWNEFEDHLNHLKSQCGPHVRELVSQSVDEVCAKMAELVDEEGRLICQEHRKILQLPPQSPTELKSPTDLVAPRTQYQSAESASSDETEQTEQTEKEEDKDRRWKYEKAEHTGPCSQIKLNRPIPCSLPLVTVEKEGEHVHLSYNNLSHRINPSYFDKLEMLYRIHCPEDEDLMDFDARVWCLLTRYQAMFGVKLHEGSGLQGSLPLPVFQVLKQHFGVTMECFASPLNCFFRQYCSAFADTDAYFGSRGYAVLSSHVKRIMLW
jgi:phosphorylated CTD-interacting factor 1